MITALVTGIGGTRSIGVAQALRMSTEPIRIIGTDANFFNAGSFQTDVSYILPLASDPSYIEKLKEIITSEKVDIIFGTVEKEVITLAGYKDELEALGPVVVLPDPSILDISFDKYKTQEFLKENSDSSIPCIYSDNKDEIDRFVETYGLPIIRKPVHGIGSKGVSIIRTPEDVAAIELDHEYVLQQYIEDDNIEKYYNTELNEYTAEIFVNKDHSIAGGIVMKRALHAGETVAGYVLKDESIVAVLSKIAEKLRITGPCNFQFRISGGKIYIFEINPLFSGTTPIRAGLGFNSVLFAVSSFVQNDHQKIRQDQLQEKYFLRYLDEVFVDKEQLDTLRDTGVIRNG